MGLCASGPRAPEDELRLICRQKDGSVAEAKRLIEKGADLNFVGGSYSLLHLALNFENYPVAALLIACGAEVKHKYFHSAKFFQQYALFLSTSVAVFLYISNLCLSSARAYVLSCFAGLLPTRSARRSLTVITPNTLVYSFRRPASGHCPSGWLS